MITRNFPSDFPIPKDESPGKGQPGLMKIDS